MNSPARTIVQTQVSKRRTRYRIELLALFVLALTVRLVFCAEKTGLGRAIPDGYREYILVGQRLLEHGVYTTPLVPDGAPMPASALMPPIYAGLVAGVYALLGSDTFAATLVLQLINACATALATVVVFAAARRLGGNVAGWVGGVCAALNPTLFGFTHLIWDTSLFILGVAVSVWLAVRLGQRPFARLSYLGYGLWLGLLALLNPALTLAYPLLILWPISKSAGWKLGPVSTGVGLSLLGWAVAITPWTIRNAVQFDRLIYVRYGLPMELWFGVCPEANTRPNDVYRAHFPLLNERLTQEVVQHGELTYIERCGKRAWGAIVSDPLRLLWLMGRRFVDYWAGTVFTHAPPGKNGWPDSPSRALAAAYLSGEVLLIVLLLAVTRGGSRDARWLVGLVVVFSLIYTFTHIQIRYRAPSEPITAILLGTLAALAWSRSRKPERP